VGDAGAVTWRIDLSGPTFTVDRVTSNQNTGIVAVTYHADEALAAQTCTLDGRPCEACSGSAALCGQAAAGEHPFAASGTDALGNPGAPTTHAASVSYGPSQGRLYLIGMDHRVSDASADAVLHAAVAEVPWRRQGSFDRKIRVAAFL